MRTTRRQTITETLRREIADGAYPAHEAMPGEHALCARFGVTRATLRLALDDLERQGLIYRHHGSGTFANPARSVMAKPIGLLLMEAQKATTVGNVPIISGATYYLESVGSYLALVSKPPTDWPSSMLESLAGLIIVPPKVEQKHLDALSRAKIPSIVVGDSYLPGPCIGFGFHDAAVNFTNALVSLGHRQFAMISGHDAHGDAIRKAAIAATLSAAGINPATVPDERTNYDPAAAWDAANRLLDAPSKPTAVICFDDTLALQMTRACAARGLRVPADISVVGFGDAPDAPLVTPALSTVAIPFERAGRMAAEMLCRSVLHGDEIRSVDLGHTITLRESTGKAA